MFVRLCAARRRDGATAQGRGRMRIPQRRTRMCRHHIWVSSAAVARKNHSGVVG